jgi:CBS domain containing-hemolysin-like protein
VIATLISNVLGFILSAEASSTTIDWVAVVAQGGPFALVVVLFVTGRIVPGQIYERRVEEVAQLQDQIGRLEQIIEDKIIPALVRSTDTLARDIERQMREERLVREAQTPGQEGRP